MGLSKELVDVVRNNLKAIDAVLQGHVIILQRLF